MTASHTAHGFSLIELLVALSILAVVAALIVPRFLNVRGQAQATVLAAQLEQLNRTYDQWLTMGGNINGATGIQVVKFLSSPYNVTDGQREDAAGNAVTFCTDSTGVMNSSLFSLTLNADTSNAGPTASSSDGFYKAKSGGAGTGDLYYKLNGFVYPVSFNAAGSPAFTQTTGAVVGNL